MRAKVSKNLLGVLFVLFTLSGFSGLIYESIWSHYLKLFLGHAAYAQTLVLAIFMGGMALGAWICSRYSLSWKNPLICYALVEGVIGLFALLFHSVFDQTVRISYYSVIPHLKSAEIASLYKWTLSVLMILPQSVLLGMTFPLMSVGIMRLSTRDSGRTISLLYFTNSIGAALGVLVSGFVLIRLVGLPWTIRIAGLINVALALFVWFLMRERRDEAPAAEAEKGGRPDRATDTYYLFFLFASLITGAASFIYEIGWLRMLSLVLGSSTHAFELMLSAFIFGLAFGGLWMHRRIDGIIIPERYLAYVQVIMGFLALSTLPLYGRTFEVMEWLMKTLDKTDGGYLLFNLSSNAIALAVMVPATLCAGMTLPLITFTLIKKGYGERSVGGVYAANTIGAIVGILFAVHIGMPGFGLKGLISIGAALDIALGVALLWRAAAFSTHRLPAMITAASLCVLAATSYLADLDQFKMSSGVYRTGRLLVPKETEMLFYRDGETATVSAYVGRYNGILVLNTNGKPDATMSVLPNEPATPDEPAMVLLAALPMLYHPNAQTAAIIGFGSGLTTHTVLGNPLLTQVDTMEIESKMVEAGNYFRPRVERAYADPRSRIFIDDAKTYISVHNMEYDIIISQPSNPWVSGVASLFTEEFYDEIDHHLTEHGIFVQWMQLYEINIDLVVSVLKGISAHFEDFAVYASNDSNIIIIAKNKGALAEPQPEVLSIPALAKALARMQINTIQDIEIRKICTKKYLSGLLETFPVPVNSDYYPVLDQNAVRTRFLGSNAFELQSIAHQMLPVLDILERADAPSKPTELTPDRAYRPSQAGFEAMGLRDYFLQGKFPPKYAGIPSSVKEQATAFLKIFYECRSGLGPAQRMDSLVNTSIKMTTYLTPSESDAVWRKMESGPCARSLSTEERSWIALFKAVGRRDPPAMANAASVILGAGQPMPIGAKKYVVASGMLGALMQGDQDALNRLWSAHKDEMSGGGKPDLLFRFLAANSGVPIPAP